MEKIFNNEKSLFRQKINSILEKHPVKEIVEDLIRLHLLRVASKDENQLVLVELYNLLGAEQFAEVLEVINGKKIHFPSAESFKETVEIALSYYFKHFQHRSWDDIRLLLQNENFSTIKYSINCAKLEQFIKELSSVSLLEDFDAEQE